jgi:hypothetical protein
LPVKLAVGRELREVVVEGTVNHAVRYRCPAAQAFEIFQITAMNLSPDGDKRVGACL